MIVSSRRLAANRNNALLSTGPKTELGKLASRNNALRHGLARPVTEDADAATRVEFLAKVLEASRNDPWYCELARDLAESLVDLQRVRGVRAQILHQLGDLENADAAKHAWAANQIRRIGRYEQRALARYSKALKAYFDPRS
jgi:hypothetical protein